MQQIEKNLRLVVRKIISEAPRKGAKPAVLGGDPDGREWIARVKAAAQERELNPALQDLFTNDTLLLALAGALPAGETLDKSALNRRIVSALSGAKLLDGQKFLAAFNTSSFGALAPDDALAAIDSLIIRTCGAVVGTKDLIGKSLGPEERANIRSIMEREYLPLQPTKAPTPQAQTK